MTLIFFKPLHSSKKDFQDFGRTSVELEAFQNAWSVIGNRWTEQAIVCNPYLQSLGLLEYGL